MSQPVRTFESRPRPSGRSRGRPRPWIKDRTPVAVPALTVVLAVLLLGSLAWSKHCVDNRPPPSELVLLEPQQ